MSNEPVIFYASLAFAVFAATWMLWICWRYSQGRYSRRHFIDELLFYTGLLAAVLAHVIEDLSDTASWLLTTAAIVLMTAFFVRRIRGERAPAASSDARLQIERRNAEAERAYAAGDVESLAAIFASDVWQMPPNQRPLVGREAVRAFWSDAFKWGEWRFDLAAQDVVVSGEIAVERGRYQVTFTAGPSAPPGMATFEDRGSYVVLWRREPDGVWRAVWDAPVSELPPPPPRG